MGKKRRVWWLIGGMAFLVLFMAGGTALRRSSPDGRMDQRLSGVLETYGFRRYEPAWTGAAVDDTTYFRSRELSTHQIEEIAAALSDGCRGCYTLPPVGLGDTKYQFLIGDALDSFFRIEVGQAGQGMFGVSDGGPQFSYIVVGRRRDEPLHRILRWLPW